jgi:RHS repeat-associated protein
VLSTFVYGLKPNVPDYMVHGGTTYRIVSDWRGDVRLVLDTTKTGSAAVVQQIDYDEWGNVTNLVDPACTLGGTELCFQPFGFAGGIFEPATGLVRFGARDYDPQARRWASKDPIRFDGGQENIYVYVGDDPVNHGDPSGLYVDPDCLQTCETNFESFTQVCVAVALGSSVLSRFCGVVGWALPQCALVLGGITAACEASAELNLGFCAAQCPTGWQPACPAPSPGGG